MPFMEISLAYKTMHVHIDPKFKECKFLTPKKYIEVKEALTVFVSWTMIVVHNRDQPEIL